VPPLETPPPSQPSTRIWRAGDIEFDESRRQLKVGGIPIELEARPRELFLLLLSHAGEVVTKEEILETVWPGRIVTDASLTKCVARLRQVLGDLDHALIVTAHGYGYRLVADVRVEMRSEPPLSPGSDAAPQAGDRIVGRPNWKLVTRLGTGGYGDAWLGEHDKTHERRVFKFALSGDQIASLKREITLFRLLNAGLGGRRDYARLLDWNLDTSPYFIEVEWSSQGNLGDWASHAIAAGSLPLPERLELASQIADALAGAHSLGVLHKDLKPSNVLIDLDQGGAPHIKLCDFGSGAALDPGRLEALGITRLGLSQVLDSTSPTTGTPLYLAPELMAGALPSLRSDVYALGVILYQLIIGDFRRPLAPGWERDVSDELLREDIARAAAGDPSQRLADAAQLATQLRTLDARRIARTQERLAQAQAQATQRALDRARARRGLWRALAVTLVLALSATAWLAYSAQRARRDAVEHSQQARAVTDFLINDILAATNPTIAGTHDARLLPLLDKASDNLEQRFAAQPVVLAELQNAMGAGYAALFETDKAERLLLAAEKGLAENLGDSAPETQSARMSLWYLYTANVDIEKLYRVSQRIAAAEQAAGRADSGISLRARMMLAWIPCVAKAPQVMGLSNCADVVRPFYLEALQRFGREDETTAEMTWYLGVALMYASREDQAEPVLREACNALERHYDATKQRLAECRRYLAWALDADGKSAEALPILSEIAKNNEKTLGAVGQFTLIAYRDLARTLIHVGDFAQALDYARRASTAREGAQPDVTTEMLESQQVLAEAMLRAGQTQAGLTLGTSAMQSAIETLGPRAPLTASLRDSLGHAYLQIGDAARAETLFRENVALAEQLPERPNWYVPQLQVSLAEALVAQRRELDGRPLLQASYDVLNRTLGPENRRTRAARAELVRLQ
jgi:eukaryotic-like serine/threonine-protein kinase